MCTPPAHVPMNVCRPAISASALTRCDQGRALLPWMLRYQVPMWPERSLTRNNAEELELKAKLEGELPIEEDISRWFGLYGSPV